VLPIDPVTYNFVKKQGYEGVHAKGEVWAILLFEAYWQVIAVTPFDDDWLTGGGGNNDFFRLLIDGMKLQVCQPSFVHGRDAILLADRVNFNGKYGCALWRGFAKRGLGLNAKAGGHQDFTVPRPCDP
jgi:extracellular elastinolytic metalloproteinase